MKRAVVLGGGGSRGAYQIGVWKGLRELSYEFDIVCGTSVGSLNGALMVQNELERAIELWSTIKTRDVFNIKDEMDVTKLSGRGRLFREFIDGFVRAGGVDTAPLEAVVRELLDEDKVRKSKIDYGLITVEYPTMHPIVLTKENIPEGMLCDYLMASSACYPAMKSRVIADKKYIDGAYYSNLPIEIALEKGATEIVAVDLESIGVIRPIKAKEAEVKRIHSNWDLGLFLFFDPEVSKRNIALGYNDALKVIGGFEGEYYTFYPGESALNRTLIKNAMKNSIEKLYVDVGVNGGRFLRAIAQQSLRNIMGGHPALATASTIRGWAESAARVLGMDPTAIYTFQRMNALLRGAADKIGAAPPKTLSYLNKVESGKKDDAKDVSPEIDRGHILVYIRSLIERAKEHKGVLDTISILANLFPAEFLGALYIYLLDEAYKANR